MPTLRSSTTASGNNSAVTTPTSTPGRKVPHCTKCGRPRAGHPRSGCPYADSPSAIGKETLDTHRGADGIADALGSMYLDMSDGSPTRRNEGETKIALRNRRRLSTQPTTLLRSDTLLSLSTNSSEIMNRMMKPDMFDREDEERTGKADPQAKIVRWQETLGPITSPEQTQKQKRVFSRSPMPGTLIPPTPDTSFLSSQNSQNSAAKVETSGVTGVPTDTRLSATPSGYPAPAHTPRPVARSMSLEQREEFISKVTKSSTATVYILPQADIPAISEAAAKLDMHFHVLIKESDPDEQGFLIVGSNKVAVDRLRGKVEEEDKKSEGRAILVEQDTPVKYGRRTGTFRAAAGGAVVGAVTTWAGLAFS